MRWIGKLIAMLIGIAIGLVGYEFISHILKLLFDISL